MVVYQLIHYLEMGHEAEEAVANTEQTKNILLLLVCLATQDGLNMEGGYLGQLAQRCDSLQG